ncbi:Hint domain-containing protein [Maritimibacter sp. UBA3975]|uniref:Hint domain-containing protein n=1 Tax=Maritimibacter sp. UBA3975 TaxID=1946833 RepID=UPI000C09BC8A|nr:Hint domain-containing protein [Maritimibacter sp. UBA3975]MAM62632.1 hemolysin-type calcium-binding protein [Maritimibacter sp.]|tara:strand:- start:13666 stop:14712 length:1047 start_codon:yes stop_codon:yes gene_type:complete
MKTGIIGSFVISWSQTEVDGLADAPRGSLGVGASWRWSGTALRVDGPQDVIRLDLGEQEADIRRRAARKVRRLTGSSPAHPKTNKDEDSLFDMGFTVTDGFRSYPVTMMNGVEGRGTLLMFSDGLPPSDRDLWVVQAQIEAAVMNRLTDQPTGVICFTPGTRIRTADGDIAVEEIREGTRIQTKDNGLQDVLWIGEKRVSGARLYAMPELRPVRVRQGALGDERPDGDLIVSPAHRMLLKGARAQALFGTNEVLVAARDLIDDRRVTRDRSVTSVTYIHLLLDRHEVVFANGLETESFLPEGEALDAVEDVQREQLLGAMPSLAQGADAYSAPARRLLTQAEAAIMGA